MSLVDIANGKQRHVPYRDSKLTFLLHVNIKFKELELYKDSFCDPNIPSLGDRIHWVETPKQQLLRTSVPLVGES